MIWQEDLVYVFGQEEAKELAEVIDGKYLFRYGLMEDKNFKKRFLPLRKSSREKWERLLRGNKQWNRFADVLPFSNRNRARG